MKQLSVLMLALAFIATSSFTTFANSQGTSSISGNYEGVISAKVFHETNGNVARVKSNNKYEVDLMFNGTVFILKSNNFKCMGNYSVIGDVVYFEVTSTKGNESLAKSFFEHQFKFSTSGKRLMLISDEETKDAIIIYDLKKI